MLRLNRVRWRTGLISLGLLGAILVGVSVTGFAPAFVSNYLRGRNKPRLETWKVARTGLNVTLAASAHIDSSERTIIECELEKLGVSVKGNTVSSSGASVILSVIPEGSTVRKGDVICELDSSDYVEMARQQQINLERAQTDYEQANLNHQIAQIAVIEYRDGLMFQTLKQLRGQIALAEADVERGRDRLLWSHNMLEKGYLPKGQITTDEFALNRLALTLKQGQTSLNLFETYSAPKYLKVLESAVLAAKTTLSFEAQKLQRTSDRLKKLQSQVELCTIRAPHDGFLIYENDAKKDIRIEAGVSVRQRQKMFYLPDLDKMEAVALIHESVVKDVQPGMSVRVTVEGLPGRSIIGHVTSVSQLPSRDEFNEVRYFAGKVKLDNIPEGLKPGMSAEVEIGMVYRDDVLAIPAEAMTIESGEDICYVRHGDHFERRTVTLGQSTRGLLEVKAGLDEGEQVVIDPRRMEIPLELVTGEPEDVAELEAPSTVTQ